MREPTAQVTMDMELMKALAESIAAQTVKELGKELKQEIRGEIQKEFQRYFGDITPTQHAVQHSRIDKLLNILDRTTSNFLTRIIGNLLVYGVILVVLGHAYWDKLLTFFKG